MVSDKGKEMELHVEPTGADGNDGSSKSPLATIEAARNVVREHRQAGFTGHATVRIGPGTYHFANPLTFGPEDSGPTRYIGEPGAVVDGGREIGGFVPTRANGIACWSADVPEYRLKRPFRQLWINGERRPRARFPKFSFETPEGLTEVLRMGEIRGEAAQELSLFDGDYRFKPSEGDLHGALLANPESLYDAEAMLFHYWVSERMPQLHYSSRSGWLESSRQSRFALRESGASDQLARYFLDNLFEALSEPGEWYLDHRAGKLYYVPLAGETIETTTAVAPVALGLVEIRGVPFNRSKMWGDPGYVEPVTGLQFEGLSFRHVDVAIPQSQKLFHDTTPQPERPTAAPTQAVLEAPGVLSFMAAKDCSVIGCTIEQAGPYGIDVGLGCRRIDLIGNTLRDLGGGGVKIHGGEVDEAPWRRTGCCVVSDNRIERGGRVFPGSVGILLGLTNENVVSHNSVQDFFYTGISVGWSWGYKETASRDNLILDNRITKIGQGLISDMGAIYVLGVQPGTVIAGNVIDGIRAYDYGSWGVYLDEGSSHILVEENWVNGTQGPCVNIHYGRGNTIQRNLLFSEHDAAAQIGRVEGHISGYFRENVVVSRAGRLFRCGYWGRIEDGLESDHNLFLVSETPTAVVYKENRGMKPTSLDEWKTAGKDRDSRFERILYDELQGLARPRDVAAILERLGESVPHRFSPSRWSKAGVRSHDERTIVRQPAYRGYREYPG